MKRGGLIGTVKNGCVTFTVITLITYSVGAMLSTADKAFIPTLQWVWLFLVFSMLFSGANQLLRQDRFSLAVRILLHAIATTALFVVAVLICGGIYKNTAVALITTLIYLLLYCVFAGCYVLFSRRRVRKSADGNRKKYTSVFHS